MGSMDQEFLNAYSQLLVRTCHARGALAMGGMSAFIPAKDPQEMERVTAKVIEDKQREIQTRPRWHVGSTSSIG